MQDIELNLSTSVRNTNELRLVERCHVTADDRPFGMAQARAGYEGIAPPGQSSSGGIAFGLGSTDGIGSGSAKHEVVGG
jgi:hypothetical protein